MNIMGKFLTISALLSAITLPLFLNSCHFQNRESAVKQNEPTAIFFDEQWNLIGSGDYTYLFFRVYNVKLYGKTTTLNNTSTPKIIKLDYLRNIDASVSKKANNKAILLNASAEELTSFQSDWDNINSFVESVTSEHSLIIKHDSEGLQLSYPHLNKSLTVKNPQLAQHYVDIWLGEKNIDQRLRDKLLAK